MSGLPLSPKHGVNPTLPVCFWCGEDRGELVLLGKLKGDAQAPMRCVLDYEPCDSCRDKLSLGVVFVEATDKPRDNTLPIQERGNVRLYPTGRYAVIKREAVERWVAEGAFDPGLGEQILKHGKTFVDPECYEGMGLAG